MPRLGSIHPLLRRLRLVHLSLHSFRCLEALEVFVAQSSDDQTLLEIADEEMKIIKREIKDARLELTKTNIEMDKLKKDQSAKEVYAIEAMLEKLAVAKEELNEYIAGYRSSFSPSSRFFSTADAVSR